MSTVTDPVAVKAPPDVELSPDDKFRANYDPDPAKWTPDMRRYYSERINNAFRDALETASFKRDGESEKEYRARLSRQCESTGSLKSNEACAENGCAHCAARMATAEVQKALTGYDYRSEKQ